MRILWMTWKDKKNPLAGGAEIVNEELAKRLCRDGHEVVFLVGGFEGGLKEEIIDKYKVIRVGNRATVYFLSGLYYRKNLKGWADLVIDEVNTIPFFAKFYVKEKNILFVHQLCRQIWFYEMIFPLSLVGYLLEPFYLWLLRDRKVITVSQSSRKDLMRLGFKQENIAVISEGIEIDPMKNPELDCSKFELPTMLSLGAIRSMKRTDHIVKAFELAKEKIPNLQLIVAGQAYGNFGKMVVNAMKKSKHCASIKYLGRIPKEQKVELMGKAHIICVSSVKEGWGLIVTEANSQGTPAVVYDVDGLRDSVRHQETGLICPQEKPESMAACIVDLLADQERYDKMRINGWNWSKEINFDKSYADFCKNIL